MLKKLHSVFTHHWTIFLYAVVSVITAFICIVYAQDVGLRAFDLIARNQQEKLIAALEKEKRYVETSVQKFGANADVRGAILSRDTTHIKNLLEVERQRTDLTAYTVVDEYGIALSRSPIEANLGDNVFLTLPAGRLIVQGVTSAVYGSGRNFSLTMGAGHLIYDTHNDLVGAVFGGYWFDDAFAHRLLEQYLPEYRNQEIIFYSKEDGITGTTIEDKTVLAKLPAYINAASAFMQESRSGDLLRIDNTDYVVTNYPIGGEEDIYGGVLLLTPLPLTLLLRSLLVSLAISIVFFFGLLALEKITIPEFFRWKKKTLYATLCTLTGVVFFALWVAIYSHGKLATTYLETPDLVIYNSTMRIRPGSGVYTIGYPQQSSIIIHSGGEPVNAIEVKLQFNPKVLKVNELLFNRSVCSRDAILEQEIDNELGYVHIACAIVDKPFDEPRGVVADIDFTPHASGGTGFSFVEGSQVFAADGLATEVLRSATPSFYRIFTEEDIQDQSPIRALAIPYSPTHENSSKWYNSKQISVLWSKVPSFEYVYEFSENDESAFSNPQVTLSSKVKVTAPHDGIFYFKLALKKGGTIGPISILQIRIDTTSPQKPDIKASSVDVKKDDIVRFEIASQDDASGLQKNFYIRLDNGVWLPTVSKLFIPFHDSGYHTLYVRVFDNAENFSETKIDVRVRR